MSDASVEIASTPQRQAPNKTRKLYHTPKMEIYGAVRGLTRGGGAAPVSDGPSVYTSIVP